MRTPSCSLGSSLVYFNGILCVPECKLCTSDAKLAAVLPSLNFPLCMSVCVCGMCRCVDRHSQDCACKGRDQRRTPGVLLHHSGPLRRSLTEPGARPAASEPRWFFCLHHAHGGYTCAPAQSAFKLGARESSSLTVPSLQPLFYYF